MWISIAGQSQAGAIDGVPVETFTAGQDTIQCYQWSINGCFIIQMQDDDWKGHVRYAASAHVLENLTHITTTKRTQRTPQEATTY
jgi:hypothetical protein